MKVGETYKATSPFRVFVDDSTPAEDDCHPLYSVLSTSRICPWESFLVTQALRTCSGDVNWYKILAPSAMGWLTIPKASDRHLDKTGECGIEDKDRIRQDLSWNFVVHVTPANAKTVETRFDRLMQLTK